MLMGGSSKTCTEARLGDEWEFIKEGEGEEEEVVVSLIARSHVVTAAGVGARRS